MKLWGFSILSNNHFTVYEENIKRLTGAKAGWIQWGSEKSLSLVARQCLSFSLTDPASGQYYISSGVIYKWFQRAFLIKFQFVRLGNMTMKRFNFRYFLQMDMDM
jgi:hypothetical protein